MALPASWTSVTVTGTYANRDGTPASGWVTFESQQTVIIGGVVIVPKTITAVLDGTGAISVAIPSTNDPDLSVTGWGYLVTERIPDARPPYQIEVPYSVATLDLATVTPALPAPITPVTSYLRATDLGVTVATQGAVATAQGTASAAQSMATTATATAGAAQTTANTAVTNAATAQTTADNMRLDLASTVTGNGAALVGFKQAGTGATARTTQDKAREVVSILDYYTSLDTSYSTALTAAYNAVAVGGTIKLPQGLTYNLLTGLTISKSVTIKGDGRDLPAITCDGSFSPFVIAAGTNGVRFDSFQIAATGAPKTAGTAGVKAVALTLVAGIGYLQLDNMNINGFEKGVSAQFCQLGQINNCRLWANKYGYASHRCVNMTLDQTIMESNTLWGCFIDGDVGTVSGSAGTMLSLCEIVGNGSAGGGTDGGNFFVQYNEHFSLDNCMIDVPSVGSKHNVRAVGVSRGHIGGGSWVGAGKGSNIYFTGCDGINIGLVNVLSAAGYGIEIETSSNCVITSPIMSSNGAEDIVIYGASGTNNVINGGRLQSTVSANSITETGAHATTVTAGVRAAGLIALDTGSFQQKRMYSSVLSLTLTGGVATETINVPLPSGLFAVKPDYVEVVGVTFPISFAYKYSDAATTATNARGLFITIDGAALPAGAFSYSVMAYGR